ncbi:MAG: hypothetical protein FWF83_05470, partial [Clostridiales bacterium]|nr:hypothetical protein [Clostridiales bacterium]
MNFAKAEHRIYKRFMTRVWILSLMTAMVLTAALGTVAFAEESGEVTLHFIKSWDGIRRAAGVCRYFDLDTGDAIRDRDIVVALIGGTHSFGVPL